MSQKPPPLSTVGNCWTSAPAVTLEEAKKSIQDVMDSWDHLPRFPEPMKLEMTRATYAMLKRMSGHAEVVADQQRKTTDAFFCGYPIAVVEDAGPSGWRLVPLKQNKEPTCPPTP